MVNTRKGNATYVHKKPRDGEIKGTHLTAEDCADIHKLLRLGCTKKRICALFNISRYYLRKVLNLHEFRLVEPFGVPVQ